MQRPEISIVIPAYKRVAYLKRLFASIAEQTFSNYEVVVTDDSPDTSVADLIDTFSTLNNIRYFKNNPALGTPENWNEGIRGARGKWIKLMHDDDWFATNDALQKFHDVAEANPGCLFFFSAFKNVTENNEQAQVVKCDWIDRFLLRWSALHLFKRVYVGNPSCTFISRDVGEFYDNRFKFVVDFEYYIRCIRKLKQYRYIDDVLLNIGFHEGQVTAYTFLVPEVQVPENLMLLEKLGAGISRNVFVYDYYWRMFRNLKIRSIKQVENYYSGEINPRIKSMIIFQSTWSLNILNVGVFSKMLMFTSYFRSLLASIKKK